MLMDSLPPMECIWAMQNIMIDGAEWPFSIQLRMPAYNQIEAQMNPVSKFCIEGEFAHDNDNNKP